MEMAPLHAMRAGGLAFDPQNIFKLLSMVSHAINPRSGRAEAGWSLEFTPPASPTDDKFKANE